MAGRFIVFEGIDGSGKSVQIENLREHMLSRGLDVEVTKEPTSRNIGTLLRRFLTGGDNIDNRTAAALFLADRLDHITAPEDGLLALLCAGKQVLCDRYYFSSYAYNSVDVNLNWVIEANSICYDLLRPDMTIFLDITVEAALDRIGQRLSQPDADVLTDKHDKQTAPSFEKFETLERLTAARERYFEAFNKLRDKENICIIDASRSIEEVSSSVWAAVSPIIDGR